MSIILNMFLSLLIVLFANGSEEGSPSQNQNSDIPTNSIYIKVGEAKLKKNLMAIPAFQYTGNPLAVKSHQPTGALLFQTVQNNLSFTDYFKSVNPEAFLEDVANVNAIPAPADPKGFKFDSWLKIGVDFLMRANYSITDKTLTFETYVYHVPKAQLIMGKKYRGSVDATKKIANTFCNDLLKTLTGVEGPFLSKIVATSDRDGGQAREVFVMDWDGSNIRPISAHQAIALSPAWSPDGRYVAYTAFVKHLNSGKTNSDLFLYDIVTNSRKILSYRPGINSGAAFSPDGKSIFLTLSEDGNSDIFKIGLDGKVQKKITNGPNGAANVEPALSPNGKLMAYSSERGGPASIYILDIDDSNAKPKRITFAGQLNNSPSWSPDGKQIAFAGYDEGRFDVFIMNSDGSKLHRLTSAKKSNGKPANNEHPSFSPDGRFIVFDSDRSGTNQIYVMAPDGSNERRVTQDNHNYFKPKWSSNLEQ